MALSYMEFFDHITGIELSLSGDMMLGFTTNGALNTNPIEVLKTAIATVTENEMRVKGVTEEEFAELPADSVLDPTSEKIWVDACEEYDRLTKGE